MSSKDLYAQQKRDALEIKAALQKIIDKHNIRITSKKQQYIEQNEKHV